MMLLYHELISLNNQLLTSLTSMEVTNQTLRTNGGSYIVHIGTNKTLVKVIAL